MKGIKLKLRGAFPVEVAPRGYCRFDPVLALLSASECCIHYLGTYATASRTTTFRSRVNSILFGFLWRIDVWDRVSGGILAKDA